MCLKQCYGIKEFGINGGKRSTDEAAAEEFKVEFQNLVSSENLLLKHIYTQTNQDCSRNASHPGHWPLNQNNVCQTIKAVKKG